MTQSMITKKLSAIVQISELDQMLAEMNQTIEQRDSKIERLKQMISEKKQSTIGYRDFFRNRSQRTGEENTRTVKCILYSSGDKRVAAETTTECLGSKKS